MSQLVYLASPYSHPSPTVREQRFRDAAYCAGKLMGRGEKIFSPITHTHPIAEAGNLPKDWDFWQEYDRYMLACCRAVYVLKIDGWQTSHGIGSELDIAKEFGLEIRFVNREGEFDER